MSRLIVTLVFMFQFFNVLQARTLDVVVGLAKPPYVSEGGHSGFEIELIRHVMASIGHDVNFILVPFGRTQAMLARNDVDALMTVNARTIQDIELLSDPYIIYQNVAVSNSKQALNINSISDLARYSVISFQNADKILGEEFARAMAKSPLFTSSARQEYQVQMLLQERIDVVVMDINIFNYFALNSEQDSMSSLQSQFSYHHIFPKSAYQMAIKDPHIRTQFNDAIKTTKSSLYYQQLLEKYHLRQ